MQENKEKKIKIKKKKNKIKKKKKKLSKMNSTCFTQDLVDKITIKAINECKSGTIIISFTKKLWDLGNDWECNNGFKRLMSWGIATVYVHRKK